MADDVGIVWDTQLLDQMLKGPNGAVAAYLSRVGLVVASQARLNASHRPGPEVDTGRLRNSIHFVVTEDETGLALYVGTNVEYALAVEMGRRAGARMPPVDAIEGWVRRKGIDTDPATSRSTAFAIARAIGMKGIPERPFLRPALDAARTVR